MDDVEMEGQPPDLPDLALPVRIVITTMMTKDEFSTLRNDFFESVDFVRMAHDLFRNDSFVCHHNAYLAHRFMLRRGHAALQLVNGAYQTANLGKMVLHSWLSLAVGGRTAIIFEMDPHQLRAAGCYPNDLMPGCDTNLGIERYGLATIVDPILLEIPDDLKTNLWIVVSREVLERYQLAPEVALQLDLERLDEIDLSAQESYDYGRSQDQGVIMRALQAGRISSAV